MLSPSRTYAGTFLLFKYSSIAIAMVDFPEPERPVNQTVHPLNPPFPWTAARESRVTLDLCTRMFSDVGA